jgi:hypothetical protein
MKYLEKFRAILDFWHPEETIIFFLCFLENDPAFSKALKPDGREVYLCYILSFISRVTSPKKTAGWLVMVSAIVLPGIFSSFPVF